jgi:hypothetical protein
MRAHKKTGHLYADLPSGVPSLREPCRVEIALKEGNIVSCSIISNRSIFLTGDKAYQELIRMGPVRWTFVPQSPTTLLAGSASRPVEKREAAPPRRIGTVEQWQMRSWKRMHKLVYGLADGMRRVEEIAELLSTTPEAIKEVLHDLQSMHVITME